LNSDLRIELGGQQILRYQKAMTSASSEVTNSALVQVARLKARPMHDFRQTSHMEQWQGIIPSSGQLRVFCSVSGTTYAKAVPR